MTSFPLKSKASFQSIVSPLSLAIMLVSFTVMIFVFFTPSFLEITGFALLDAAILNPLYFFLLDRQIFPRLYPETKFFISDVVDYHHIQNLDDRAKHDVLNMLLSFPRRRAKYAFFGSWAVKGILGVFIIAVLWAHQRPTWIQAIYSVLLFSLMYAYFYAVTFMETHGLVTNLIADIHQRFDWSKIFMETPQIASAKDFKFQEYMSLGLIWFLVLGLQWLVVATNQSLGYLNTAGTTFIVGICGMALIVRAWYVGREFFTNGLERLFSLFEDFDPATQKSTLPLSSSPVLARFELTINKLLSRLEQNERELSGWIYYQAEKHRFSAIGEFSALITHDLANPIHVILFCSKSLAEDGQTAGSREHVRKIYNNALRANDLITSLKAYLKDPVDRTRTANLRETHAFVTRILTFQFAQKDFIKIKITLTEEAASLTFGLPRSELIHILGNIYANSFKNLIDHQITNPELKVDLAGSSEREACLAIEDNGTGLSKDEFEALTTFDFLKKESIDRSKGLGLRLTKRLVEQRKGSLTVSEDGKNKQGTRFLLLLPLAPADLPRTNQ